MRYVEARIDKYNREEAYRFYIAKSLQLAPQGKCLTIDYQDMLKPEELEKEEPELDGDEIVRDIMLRAGLRFEE